MTLKRFTNTVDGTIPVPALLYEDEVLLTSQEGVGIYDGPQKAPHHQAGALYATTHRLFYIDYGHPLSRSFSLDLSHITRTESYAGLFTSSPKVTLYLNPFQPARQSSAASGTLDQIYTGTTTSNVVEFWECEVCSNRNPVGLTSSASLVCALCGVPRASIKAPINVSAKSVQPSSYSSLSTSLPASAVNLSSLGNSPSPSPSPPVSIASPTASDSIACTACTFLNSPLLRECEICGTPLPKRPSPPLPMSHLPVRSAPGSRSATPLPDEDSDDDDLPEKRMIRLSFRKGGDKAFYTVLRRSLLGKAWESKTSALASASLSPSAGGSSSRPLGRSGINGILRSVETTAATSQSNMEDALADLEALMVKWKDMVKLAQDLNERLTAASAPVPSLSSVASTPMTQTQAVEPEEATFIRSSLAQLGLQMANAPVTQDMVRDERKWFEELAKELTGVLEGGGGRKGRGGEGMMRKRGIIALDEVWGGWNRARGVALIPPATFLQVLPHLPNFTHPPIRMRTFAASGLSVLHTPPFDRGAFTSRLVGQLTLAGSRTTVEIAQEEDLPIGLTQEMLDEVETDGEICRDAGGSGVAVFTQTTHGQLRSSAGAGWTSDGEVRWWINVFRAYVWDGQEY